MISHTDMSSLGSVQQALTAAESAILPQQRSKILSHKHSLTPRGYNDYKTYIIFLHLHYISIYKLYIKETEFMQTALTNEWNLKRVECELHPAWISLKTNCKRQTVTSCQHVSQTRQIDQRQLIHTDCKYFIISWMEIQMSQQQQT